LDYRPPQVALDIAQRKYKTPIEMHNAKPFYQIDNNDYQDWNGETNDTKRFEFETLYLEKNYTLSSVASYRPDGKGAIPLLFLFLFFLSVGTFSEEGLWTLAVVGNDFQPKLGAIFAFGNAGELKRAEGRCPYEEIGQYRNVIVRLLKGSDNMWVALPSTLPTHTKSNILFVNMGSGVFAAWSTLNALGMTSGVYDPGYKNPKLTRTQYTWKYSKEKLGALVLEVGTAEEYSSFEDFQKAILEKSKLSLNEDKVKYVSAQNHTLEAQYQPTVTYKMYPGVTPSIVDPAGVPPKIWTDGQEVDYMSWNSYEGKRMVNFPFDLNFLCFSCFWRKHLITKICPRKSLINSTSGWKGSRDRD